MRFGEWEITKDKQTRLLFFFSLVLFFCFLFLFFYLFFFSFFALSFSQGKGSVDQGRKVKHGPRISHSSSHLSFRTRDRLTGERDV